MTPEQIKIAKGISEGKNTRTISEELQLSITKVDNGLAFLKEEVGAKNSPNLVAILMRKKILK